jgi:hypothetical protein
MTNEETDLAEADRHIQEAEERIAHQEKVLEQLKRGGHDFEKAQEVLKTLMETLSVMKDHRQIVLSKLHHRTDQS